MERRLLGLVRDLEKEREEYLNQEALVKKQTDILIMPHKLSLSPKLKLN